MITFVPQFGPGANRSTYGPVIFEVSLAVSALLEDYPMKSGDVLLLDAKFRNGIAMPKAMCFAHAGYGEHPDNRIGYWNVWATSIRCKGESYEVDFQLTENFVGEADLKDQTGKTIDITVNFVPRKLTFHGQWLTKTPYEVPVGGWGQCRAIAVAVYSGWADYNAFTIPSGSYGKRTLQGTWHPAAGKNRQKTAYFISTHLKSNMTTKITLDISLLEGSEELARLRAAQI